MRNSLREEVLEKCRPLKVKKTWIDIRDKYTSLVIVLLAYIALYSFSLCFSFPQCMNIMTLENAKDLNSSGNQIIASIVGITVVIIGFIYTEIKDKSFIGFEFFSQRTYLFPIFYSALANITSMLFLSLFSDTICLTLGESNFENPVILSHYIILINVIFIAILFIKVFSIMDYDAVFKAYKKSLLIEAKQILYYESLIKWGRHILKRIYDKHQIQPTFLAYTETPILKAKNKKGYVYDVRINDLKEALEQIDYTPKDYVYVPYSFETEVSTNFPVLLRKKGEAESQQLNLLQVKAKPTSVKYPIDRYHKTLIECKEQFLNAVRNNNSSRAYDYLTLYQELYTLYCEAEPLRNDETQI